MNNPVARGVSELLSRRAVLLLVAAGVVLRLAWVAYRGGGDLTGGNFFVAPGEAYNVAVSFAQHGVFGDAFGRGDGATAHLTPTMPLLAGMIYAAFGVEAPVAELLLMMTAIALSLSSAVLWYKVMEELGTPRYVRLIALAAFCILPFKFLYETSFFRAWEGALAAAVGAATLLMIVRSDKAENRSLRNVLWLTAMCALTLFVNPAVGLAAYGAFGLLLIRRYPVRRWPIMIGGAAVTLVMVLAPWTLRNAIELGHFVPLRSNVGLELAIGNHPAATTDADGQDVFLTRMHSVHPLQSASAHQLLTRLGGEVEYSRFRGAEAQRWIVENPVAFAKLCAKHLLQFYFPPKWNWTVFTKAPESLATRQAIIWTLSTLALTAAIMLHLRSGTQFAYLSAFILLPALPYMVAQPTLRYGYTIFAPSLFAAAFLVFHHSGIGQALERMFRSLTPRVSSQGRTKL